MRSWICALAFATVAMATGSAAASIIQYPTRALFDASVSTTVQNFDGIANGTVLGTVNGVTYATSGGSVVVTNAFLPSTSPNGIGGTDVGYFLASDTVTFTFASPIVAFGIDINTFAPADGAYSGLTNLGDIASSFVDPFPGFGTGQFMGFVSNAPFSSITLSAASGFTYTLDTLRTSVPEPGPIALIGMALLSLFALGIMRRRAEG